MSRTPLPDQAARDRILHDLGTSMLVEAAAGTGKTTSMVGRMVNLLQDGCCAIDTMCAVTFTRKAAAEMRDRFQLELEKRASETSGAARERLHAALAHLDRCFVGTIHSFCARLLRERPVEAGVDVGFVPAEEDVDKALRRQAWDEHCAALHAQDDPLLAQMDALGLDLADMTEAFMTFATYPDVDEWPCEPAVPLPDRRSAGDAFRKLAAHAMSLDLGPEYGKSDSVVPLYRRMWFLVRVADFSTYRGAVATLSRFEKEFKVTPTKWPGDNRDARKRLAESEADRCNRFRDEVALPFLDAVRQHRYALAVEVLKGAVRRYDELRKNAGILNYQDLLLKAAGLLRDGGRHVRSYFERNVSHLLVDEFQDTDPIQAEVMMLLTADDPGERDWRQCRPRRGSLFVVGDPKQSIYRFRRADIGTYNDVRRIIQQHGGAVVTLSTNFRSLEPILDWVNNAFTGQFPPEADEFSPAYVRLEAGKGDAPAGPTVRVIHTPADCTKKDDIAAWEADFIARTIRAALDAESPARPGDFLVTTRVTERMSVYARALQRLGIPHQVTGGVALNELSELRPLLNCLEAVVHPQNPVSLVAVLRGELFGVDDRTLYAFRRAGGEFNFRRPVPAGLPAGARAPLEEAFSRLQLYATWMRMLPPAPAVRRMAADLGLPALAAAAEGGNVQAGSLAKAFELLHMASGQTWSPAEVAAYLRGLAESEEKHDGLPAREEPEPPVRVMNLHKVKGLQAPVVFLADPSGEFNPPPRLHVRRDADAVRGYMCISTKNGYSYRTLAHPPGWDTLEQHETEYQKAEAVRLLYVAATRAESELVVTMRAGRQTWNPWAPLEDYLKECPPVPDPGPQSAPDVERHPLPPGEVAEGIRGVDARKRAAVEPTYAVEAAKELALGGHEAPAGREAGGLVWGSIVHGVLEGLMRDPGADIQALAGTVTREVLGPELERDEEDARRDPHALAQEAVQTALKVRESDIWRRAAAAQRRLVEAPFEERVPDVEPVTLVRGVVDLAFRERDGWVIVDYKTDDPTGRLGELTAHYAPQLHAYAAAWRRATGEAVKETGIYFSHTDQYVALPCTP